MGDALTVRRLIAAGALCLACAMPAAAQTRASLDVSGGWMGFPDDGYLANELLAGTALRIGVTPRLAIGPELVYVRGDGHSHLILTGNLTFDLRAPAVRPRVTPFLVAGGGLYQTSTPFFGETFTSREGAFTAGGGVRVPAGARGTFGVEARMGWEAHVRVNAVFGWRLGPAS